VAQGAQGAPTVLVYGHYDVQPPEPLELWTSPAFEPTVRNGNIYARGAVDDKGQLWLHVAALEAHLATRGTLPVNVIVLAEGEEEVGSDSLAPFIERASRAAQVRRGGDLRQRRCSRRASRASSRRCAGSRTSRSTSPGPTATCTRGCTAARW
jgi:acetylornithine deacetylase/succinyl-diaminopimelate desuccinylase-like protein